MHVFSQYEDRRYLTSAHETMQSLKQNFERLSNTHGGQIDLLHNLLKQKQTLLLMIEFFENVLLAKMYMYMCIYILTNFFYF